MSKKLTVFAACFALLSAPLAGTAAGYAGKKHYRHHPIRQALGCPVHRIADGTLVDCQGWRLRDNSIGWDNSCFNLDYLPSQFACSGQRR